MSATGSVDKLLDTQEIASVLGVNPRTIQRWAEGNKIPHYRNQGVIRFDKAEVLQSMKKGGEE